MDLKYNKSQQIKMPTIVLKNVVELALDSNTCLLLPTIGIFPCFFLTPWEQLNYQLCYPRITYYIVETKSDR